jgi:hypothetical protein
VYTCRGRVRGGKLWWLRAVLCQLAIGVGSDVGFVQVAVVCVLQSCACGMQCSLCLNQQTLLQDLQAC